MSAEGLNMLGMACFVGEGVARDFNKAFISFMKADEMSDQKNNYIGRMNAYYAFINGNFVSDGNFIDLAQNPLSDIQNAKK